MKIELAVGTEVIINGITCVVKETDNNHRCPSCVFYRNEMAKCCNEFVCINKVRKDGKSVVLIKVPKSNAKAAVKE